MLIQRPENWINTILRWTNSRGQGVVVNNKFRTSRLTVDRLMRDVMFIL